jgi:hypothetical protein
MRHPLPTSRGTRLQGVVAVSNAGVLVVLGAWYGSITTVRVRGGPGLAMRCGGFAFDASGVSTSTPGARGCQVVKRRRPNRFPAPSKYVAFKYFSVVISGAGSAASC